MKIQGHPGITMIVDPHRVAIEQQAIFLARKMIAPQTFFAADHEIGVVITFCPGKGCRSIETNPFSPKSDFARFQNDQKDHVTESSSQNRADTRCQIRIRIH